VHNDRNTGAAEYDARVAALIGDDDDMVEYLARLEHLSDESDGSDDDLANAAPIDPDELMDEVEQFLREQE
jgi:hypothetical protein